ncbi:MAG: hypothetical protein CHACPFDD_00675 [Phycisphaerae bacterium]|nr:hypothetical protein [Phycisphaerae bacterium]
MNRLLDFLRVDDIPRMSRRNYLYERRHVLIWGMFAGMVEGNTASIVAAKTFDGSPLLVTAVWTTPMVANMLTIIWGVLARGRSKVRLMTTLGLAAAFFVASITFTPNSPAACGWLFAAQLLMARIFLAGVVTLRSSLWQANYPESHRARIAGRIQRLRALMALLVVASASALFDWDPSFYRYVYPAAALLGAAAVVLLQRIRVRGEKREIADYRRQSAGHAAGAGRTFRSGLSEAVGILRDDREFARYCTAQFCLGSANFMVDPVLAFVVTRQLGLSYFVSSALLDQIPVIFLLLSIPYWAAYFDRAGVLQFRVINSAVWVVSFVISAIAIALVQFGGMPVSADPASPGPVRYVGPWVTAAVVLLFVARPLSGLGSGGGSIAWNLGHLHFAGRHNAEIYMAIHVSLTGLRGIIMPFVGKFAYQLSGSGSFVAAAALGVASLFQFRRLARDALRRPPDQPCPAGQSGSSTS